MEKGTKHTYIALFKAVAVGPFLDTLKKSLALAERTNIK